MAEPRMYKHEVTGIEREYDPRVALACPALKEVVPEPAPAETPALEPVEDVDPPKPTRAKKEKAA